MSRASRYPSTSRAKRVMIEVETNIESETPEDIAYVKSMLGDVEWRLDNLYSGSIFTSVKLPKHNSVNSNIHPSSWVKSSHLNRYENPFFGLCEYNKKA